MEMKEQEPAGARGQERQDGHTAERERHKTKPQRDRGKENVRK